MTKRRARDPKKEARWHKIVAAERRSGQTVRQHCQETGLSESAFWFWRRELAQRDADRPTLHFGGQSSSHPNGRQRSPRMFTAVQNSGAGRPKRAALGC